MKKAKLPLGRGLKKERDNFPIFTFCTTEKISVYSLKIMVLCSNHELQFPLIFYNYREVKGKFQFLLCFYFFSELNNEHNNVGV